MTCLGDNAHLWPKHQRKIYWQRRVKGKSRLMDTCCSINNADAAGQNECLMLNTDVLRCSHFLELVMPQQVSAGTIDRQHRSWWNDWWKAPILWVVNVHTKEMQSKGPSAFLLRAMKTETIHFQQFKKTWRQGPFISLNRFSPEKRGHRTHSFPTRRSTWR